MTYGIIGYPFIMPGPVGGDLHPDLAYVNYTSIYLKTVENEVKKTTVPPATRPPEVKLSVKEEPPGSKWLEEDPEEDTDVDAENSTRSQKTEVKHNHTGDVNVFSANYDNFFNKNVNVSTASDILKNLTVTSPLEVLEKASESFPGRYPSNLVRQALNSRKITSFAYPSGDVMVNDHTQELTFLPDKELYIRWLQLATFLPVIRFTHLPSTYKDDSVLEMAKALTSLRVKIVSTKNKHVQTKEKLN